MYQNKTHAYKTCIERPEIEVGREYRSVIIMGLCGVSITYVLMNHEDAAQLILLYGLPGFTLAPDDVTCKRCYSYKQYGIWTLQTLDL